jgi:hypothetical protein
MKTMTCRQLGGPCDEKLHGSTADEIIKQGDKHIKIMLSNGDKSHQKVMEMMNNMKKNPASGMDWYEKVKKDFAMISDD